MLRDKELELATGGNHLTDSFKNHKKTYYVGGCVLAVTVILVTVLTLSFWKYHEKHKNDRWCDENPKEKLFVIEVIDNHRPINIERIKEEYGIDEERANFLVRKHQRR